MSDTERNPCRKTQRTLDWEKEQARLEAEKPSFCEKIKILAKCARHLRDEGPTKWQQHLAEAKKEQARHQELYRPTRDPRRTLNASLQAILDKAEK